MTIAMRRGVCPTLSAPMMTGDGLLVRLALAEGGFAPARLAALCVLAGRHGNGIVEVTARGSFQIRGLTAASALLLEADVAALDLPLRDGVPVETSPLAGVDPDKIADALQLARAVRAGIEDAGLSRRLGPKVSVVVDGGGNVDLSDMLADVRLTAMRLDDGVAWQVAIGGTAATARPVAMLDESDATTVAFALLEAVAAMGDSARARDLEPAAMKALLSPFKGRGCRQAGEGRHESSSLALPLIRHFVPPSPCELGEGTGEVLPLADSRFAVSVALPFGSIGAAELAAFAKTAGASEIRLAPRRSLILVCATERSARDALDIARAHGLIVDAADPRRRVFACPGAPACASGKITTRDIARRLAEAGALSGSVHVSGCEKGCAHPSPADHVLVGVAGGIAVVRNGRAADKPATIAADVDAALAALH